MTNETGGPPTPASGLPASGGGSTPQGGSLAVGPAAGAFGGPPGPANLPVPASPPRGGVPVPAAGPAPRKGSPFSISNWRVRWRLIAIITVPTVTALILGVIQIVSAVDNYSSYTRTQNLASMNRLVVQAAGLLADERDASAGFVAAGGQGGSSASAPLKKVVAQDVQATDVVTKEISDQAPSIVNGNGYRAQTVLDLTNGVLASISDLNYI